MSHSVDSIAALAVLTKAARTVADPSFKPNSSYRAVIQQIITGSHLTYRYILITALLAKATNPSINPLAIQATASIPDAYDARSLCHSVIVRNEASLLQSSLGGSNEPYLNKPARFPFLSKTNAVRGGSDKRTLEVLCDTLPKFDSREKSYEGLCDAIFYAVAAVQKRDEAITSAVSGIAELPANVREFLGALQSETHHGETMVLVTALLYWLLSKFKEEDWTIEVHPVNEAGSSSNQVGDIDVYRGQDLIYTCEVKDKVVVANDVHHAVRKAAEAQSETLHIVFGKAGSVSDANQQDLLAFANKQKVALIMFQGASLVEACAMWTPRNLSLKDIAAKCIEISETARMKQATRNFLLSTIQSFASSVRDAQAGG